MKRRLFKFLLVASVGFAITSPARGASLTVRPPGDALRVVVVLDTQGESVNAVEAHLLFDPSLFSITKVDDGGSIVDAWIDAPSFSNASGTVDLAGIIPNGINTTNGTIVTMTIVPRTPGASAAFAIKSATVLLNDGAGTPAKLSTASPEFVLANPASLPTSTSSGADTDAPDPFVPKIGSDPSLFDGKYFLVFTATDARSGIDHYEVREGMGAWQTATSPYLLDDQTLSSDIMVRAVDHAGNFRVARVAAEHSAAGGEQKPLGNTPFVFFGIIIVFLVATIYLSWTILKHRRKG